MDLRLDSMSGECGRVQWCDNGQSMEKGMSHVSSVSVLSSALRSVFVVGESS